MSVAKTCEDFEVQSPPMVSIVIPLYNKAHTVVAALNSVLGQSYSNLEVIVVDDGSNDEGRLVVENNADSRVRLVTQKNQGQSSARNRGIIEAKGGLIAFLDADDYWDEEHISALVYLSVQYPEAGLCATAYRTVHNRGYILETRAVPKSSLERTILVDNYFELAVVSPFIWVGAVGVPKEVFDNLGGFLEGEHRGADREMWARIALKYDIAYDTRVSATYDCTATGRESNKTRKLQKPPLLSLLEAEMSKGHRSDRFDSLFRYRNIVLFGYLGKALDARSREEMINTLRQIRSDSIVTTFRKVWWMFLTLVPNTAAKFIVRLVGSRYFFRSTPKINNERTGISVRKVT